MKRMMANNRFSSAQTLFEGESKIGFKSIIKQNVHKSNNIPTFVYL